MCHPIEKPTTAVCPRTGSRIFIGVELLDATGPVEFICPACDHEHIWDPATFTLREPDRAAPVGAR